MHKVLVGEYRRKIRLMDSIFEFVVSNELHAAEFIEEAIAEVKRIEELLAEIPERSQTSLINQSAGIRAVEVCAEIHALIKRCVEISAFTDGAFDITAETLRGLYHRQDTQVALAGNEEIAGALACTGFEKIALGTNNRVYLSEVGARIAFNAIRKGYAADMVKRRLLSFGVRDALIDAGGTVTAFGRRVDGSPWRKGIVDPFDGSRVIAWMPIVNAAVAITSGPYQQPPSDTRCAPVINPKTGLLADGIKTVMVMGARAELAEALSIAVVVMGVEAGLDFIDQLPGLHALIIASDNSIFASQHLPVESF
jgi:thiamine biosynthesis lipoprotein